MKNILKSGFVKLALLDAMWWDAVGGTVGQWDRNLNLQVSETVRQRFKSQAK
jgi:hypothetical protein